MGLWPTWHKSLDLSHGGIDLARLVLCTEGYHDPAILLSIRLSICQHFPSVSDSQSAE
jgi:hypothetical protein